ncbi:NlpC/P60 family protein [Streptomyces mirabilis]|uniref:NlpC/P60 family protein n=1 Tax=Streptomyces mirabilis TaxID=68239 RepID=UPI003326A301
MAGEFDPLTVQEAADMLGITRQAVDKLISKGALTSDAGPRGRVLAFRDVRQLMVDRRDAAMARNPEGREALALKVIDSFWPFVDVYEQQPDTSIKVVRMRGDNNMTLMGQDKAANVDPDAVAVFGRASITAAAMKPDPNVCRWCEAWTFARQTLSAPPHNDRAYRILFQDQEPCDRDRAAWARNADVGRIMKREAEDAARVAAGEAADVKLRTDALRLAELKIGAPYVLNAGGPHVFDCAGLVSWAYRNAGNVDVPDTQSAILASREKIAVKDAVPGDLLVHIPATGPGHIAIYAGGGMVLHATPPDVAYAPLGSRPWSFALRLTRKGLTSAVTASASAGVPAKPDPASQVWAPVDDCTDDACTTALLASATRRRERALADGQTAHARTLERQIAQLKQGLGS